MNAIEHPNIYMRSLATRDAGSEVSKALPDVIAACKVAGFDLVIVETSGIGQGDAAIVPLVDVSLYVMTPEFGAASQLEKIDMLDFADFVAINKFDRKGAQDALRDVRKQVQRNRERVQGARPTRCRCSARWPRASTTTASPRSTRRIAAKLADKGLELAPGKLAPVTTRSLDGAERHRAAGARALSRRNRRDRARVSPVGRQGDADRARAAAAARGEGDARAECKDSRGSARRRPEAAQATASMQGDLDALDT